MTSRLPHKLLEAVKDHKLIPLVGAGVSMSLKDIDGKRLFPNWKGLLEEAAKTCDDAAIANVVDAMLGVKNYQQAADWARKGLKGSLWSEFFKRHFDIPDSRIDETTLSLPKVVWQLSDRVITLNYDKVLRQACPDKSYAEYDNSATSELAHFVRGDNRVPTIWHLHGKVDRVEGIVFTSESYENLYQADSQLADDYKTALASLHLLCTTCHLLFIGCSLDDAELLQQLHQQNQLFAGNTGPHYALVRACDEAAIRDKVKAIDNLQLILFADFGQPLLDIIAEIAEHRTSKPEKPQPLPQKAEQATKIALLTACPIDQRYEYADELDGFKKLGCQVDHFPLTLEKLNDLSDYSYLLLLTRVVRGKLVVEKPHLASRRVSLKEIEDNLFDDGLKGLILFVDELPDKEQLAGLELPTAIIANANKQLPKKLVHLLNKQKPLSVLKDCQLKNWDDSKMPLLDGSYRATKCVTRLPSTIDPKTVRNYVGRQQDLQLVSQKLLALRPGDGVLTLLGSGGIGKTTLIKKVTVELAARGHFPDGIEFIDCEFFTDFNQFEFNAAQIFDLEQAENIRDWLRTNDYVKDALLILDNFETLLHLDDKDAIVDLLSFICDYCKVVVTSREELELPGEDLYTIRAFTLDEAEQLFLQETGIRLKDKAERELLRQDILDELLAKNPLAITLVTKNLPKGKSLAQLKADLESDFFNTVRDIDLAAFDSESDDNIERKRSLYASILYSYRQLTEKEKQEFELLSLFPDGINLKSLREISDDIRLKQRSGKSDKPQPMAISDVIVKKLEQKSLVENNSGLVRLQSIVGKFAQQQLGQRENCQIYYDKLFEYCCAMLQIFKEIRHKNNSLGIRLFSQQQNNILMSIQTAQIDEDRLGAFAEATKQAAINSIPSNCRPKFAHVLKHKRSELSFDRNAQQLIDIQTCTLEYYDGNFDSAFEQLQRICPLEDIDDNRQPSNGSLKGNDGFDFAMSIYSMEGHVLKNARFQSQQRQLYSFVEMPDSLFYLGEFDFELTQVFRKNFFNFGILMCLGQANLDDIDSFIDSIFEKHHIEIIQTTYLKAQLAEVERSTIQKLVPVNPYTLGLIDLMYAFIETDIEKTHSYYQSAIKNLEHIKYFYVEAMLHYARFLQNIDAMEDFGRYQKQGLALSLQYHFRYLTYRFEDLLEPKTKPYDKKDYPLPDGENFDEFIDYLKKKYGN